VHRSFPDIAKLMSGRGHAATFLATLIVERPSTEMQTGLTDQRNSLLDRLGSDESVAL
jgi:hypothetical protein